MRRRARAVERAISAIATSLALREIPLQPSVPVAEQRADPRCDNRRQQPQRGPQLEGEAIAHKGFGITACSRVRSWRHSRMLNIVDSSSKPRPRFSLAIVRWS